MLWSAKESALKALCCGLRMDTRSVNAAPVDDPRTRDEEWRRVSVAHINGRTYHGWWRESHDLVYTVVADPPPLGRRAAHRTALLIAQRRNRVHPRGAPRRPEAGEDPRGEQQRRHRDK